ncbi:MAG: LysR family transcriptional regulator [Lachnospiraceae bacterium]|nr:LysR family transcriptional regulator [Lachnospiraceae bacterium]
MDVNYELYKVFYYVGKTLSFSEASKELYISQSAVSQAIKTLEKKLGQTLFIRSTKRVTLTKEGEILYKHIESAVNLIERGENQIFESKNLNGGQLRIGASDTICRYFLVPYLNEFHKKYPKIHIKVTNGTSLKCVDYLDSNQVDLIIINSPNTKLSAVSHTEDIKEFKDVFICNKESFDLSNKVLTLEQLLDYPILMLDKNSTTSEFLHTLFLQHSLDLVPDVELSSNDLLIDLAKIGLGIAFVPDYCVNESEENVIIIKTNETLPSRKLVAAYNSQAPLTEAARYFIDLLK